MLILNAIGSALHKRRSLRWNVKNITLGIVGDRDNNKYYICGGGQVLIIDDKVTVNAVDQILAEIEKTLYEMRSLALYAAQNDLSAERRARVQTRIDELKKEIDGIAAMLIPPETPLQ